MPGLTSHFELTSERTERLSELSRSQQLASVDRSVQRRQANV